MEEGFERVAFFFRKRNSVQQCPFMEGARVEGGGTGQEEKY